MAYFDRDEHVLLWLAAALGDEVPADCHIDLMMAAPEPEADIIAPEASRGYIIQDWFGPFLLSPSRRHERGRC